MKKVFQSIVIIAVLATFTQCESKSNPKETVNEESFAAVVTQDSIVVDMQDVDTVVVLERKLNKKNLVIKEWNTNVQTHTKVLDHVETYNPEGKKIEEIEYGTDGSQKWRKRYEYNSNGYKLKETVYDEHNRLVTIKKFEYNEYGKKKITYTYNSKGTLIAIKNYEYLTNE